MDRTATSNRQSGPGVGKRRRLTRDRRGVAAIEFGIIIIPFFAILLGILQYGLSFFAYVMLDYAARQAGRELMIGNVQAASMNADTFRTNVLCPKLAPFMTCDNIVVSVQPIDPVWTVARNSGVYRYINASYTGLTPPAASSRSAAYCPGAPGTTMLIDATYRMPVFFPLLSTDAGLRLAGDSSTMLLRATTMVVAEDYQTTSGGVGC